MIAPEDVEFYKQNGYLLVRGVFAPTEVDEMRAAIDRLLQRAADANYTRNAAWEGEFIPPEQGAVFPMYQDYPYFPHEQHTMLAASVHLDDADLENGCLHVMPGSHKTGEMEHIGRFFLNPKQYTVDMGIPMPAAAGDVLFFNYLTVHGSNANLSPRPRRNVLFQSMES